MVEIAGVSFRDPVWLWVALAAIPLTAGLWRFEVTRRRLAERFVSERLRGRSNRFRAARPFLMGSGFLLAAVALAGPRFGQEIISVPQSDASRILVLDVSDSMSAEDVGTSRLSAAKAIGKRALEMHDGRVALVIFEGEAGILSPLTTDVGAVATLLDSVAAGETGVPGSSLDSALDAVLRLMDSSTGRTDVILISDGEQQGSTSLQNLPRVAARGAVVHSVVVGTTEGGRIPVGKPGAFLRDESGREVITKAESQAMEMIAGETGGAFLVNPFDEFSLSRLASAGSGGYEANGRSTTTVPIERFQWPLGAALVFLLAGSVAHRGAE
ncbi:MAG TPA: VWA domain-containing protein [Thermoanaerobaculia bacterium]|nr:VWA domain-containing protein [Thermoanaerobaculia bacterium]